MRLRLSESFPLRDLRGFRLVNVVHRYEMLRQKRLQALQIVAGIGPFRLRAIDALSDRHHIGLSTADVTLRGVLVSQGAYVAMLHGTDEKNYIVRTGDKLADGTIRTITSEMMLIQQQVNDPLSKQKEREVRKMLRHTDGTN